MKAYRIKDVKNFMGKLLGSESFDSFLLAEGTITTYNTFVIDGHMVKEFFVGDVNDDNKLPPYEFSEWKAMRSLCFDLIKGKKTPSSFKFVLLLSPQNLERTLSSIQSSFTGNDITGVFLNIRFHNQQLILTTGISYRIFSVDKTLDNEWDRLVKQFLKQHEIAFEEL